MKKFSRYTQTLLSLIILTIILNLAACVKEFCNFYNDCIYPILNGIVGTLTSWCPIAIGEIIMYLGAIALILAIIFSILLIFLRKKDGYKKFTIKYLKSILMTVVIFLFVYTINWFIPFRSDVLKVSDNTRTRYTIDEVLAVRNMIIERLDETESKLARYEGGHLVYDYDEAKIIAAMQNKSQTYPRLKGHYSHIKKAICSPFLEWMHIGGYNYIYTMEPTVNRYCSELYYPVLYAHEYSHHKGYYKENEAEFLSYITLVESDDPFLQYCGYYYMFIYIDEAYGDALADQLFGSEHGKLTKEMIAAFKEEGSKQPHYKEIIDHDFWTAQEESELLYNDTVDTTLEQAFQPASAEVAKTGWKIQGQVLKENTYSGVTLMLLQYYIKE